MSGAVTPILEEQAQLNANENNTPDGAQAAGARNAAGPKNNESSPCDDVVTAARGGVSEPQVRGLGICLAQFVHRSHEAAIDGIVRQWGDAGIDRERFDDILVYCAERRCIDAQVTCPGCRRRTQVEGFNNLDGFVRAHRRIDFEDGGLSLSGPGERVDTFPSLEGLTRGWAGEEYWFWARRVLRKLRHGIRRAHQRGEPVADEGQTPAVILVEPQLADNIGMVARAMANFGLDNLRLVAPRDGWPNERSRVAASGANYIIDESQAYPDLSEALADLNWICATTARQRDLRKPILTPEQAAAEMARRIGEGQRCGMLFGREANGLTTPEVAEADAIVMIPVNARFASLNLAQSVLILGYSWMQSQEMKSLGRVTTYERPVREGFHYGRDTPASREELNGFFEQLEAGLDEADFFRPPERRAISIRGLRTMFLRMNATSHEVRTLRGVLKALTRRRNDASGAD